MGAAAGGAGGLTALALAYFLSQFFRSFLTVLYPELSSEIGLSPGDLSDAQGAWFLIFALAQFPIGWSLDRLGPRRTGSVLMAIGCGGGSALFALAGSPTEIILAMGLIGLGCAPILMSSLYLFGRLYAPERFATLSALLIAFGTLGNVAASSPTIAAVDAFGWRGALWLLAAASVASAAAIGALVRDPERLTPAVGEGGLGDLLRLRTLWPIIPLMTLNYAPAGALRAVWTGPYFSSVYDLPDATVGAIALGMALAMALGTVAYGPLDRLFGTRKGVVLVGNAAMLAALLWLTASPSGALPAAIAAFIAIGLFGVSFPVLLAHGRAFLPAHLLGRGVTLLNFFSIGGAGLFQVLSGSAYEAGAAAGEPVSGYAAVFALYAVCLAATLLVYLWSRDASPPR